MKKVKTQVSAKVIDEETIFEAARYMSYDIMKSAHIKREDIYQEAYILLLGRMGKPFYSSLSYATIDLTRSLYGRKGAMEEDTFQKRYNLEHSAVEECVSDPKCESLKLKGNYDEIYNELKLFAEKIGYEEEFYALAHSELADIQPYKQVMRNKKIKQSMAMKLLKEFRDEVKEHYDFEFFA